MKLNKKIISVGVLGVGLTKSVFADIGSGACYDGYGMMGSGAGYGMMRGYGPSFFELIVVVLLVAILWVLIDDRKKTKSKK
jgi:uncharacterized membrane protein